MEIQLEEGLDEIQKAQLELNQRKKAVRNAGIAECRKMIQLLGLTPADLFDEVRADAERKARKRFLYINPDNPAQTCSNYGRKPEWFKKLQAEGREIPRLQ